MLKTIAICVPTFRRPTQVAALLEALVEQREEVRDLATTRVIVVDNDSARSAQAVVAMASGLDAAYISEPEPGISAARNAAVKAAAGNDFIAFIDDDEIPRPGWLRALIEVQRDTEAEVVAGPVLPSFRSQPPKWALDGRFFDRSRRRTGSIVRWPGTGNVLIDRQALSRVPGPFDSGFGRRGGEDTFLFMQMESLGHSIIWADEAIVDEVVADERVTVKWLLRRSFRLGNALTLCESRLSRSPVRSRLIRAAKGSAHCLIGGCAIWRVLTAPSPTVVALRSAIRVARGTGMLAAALSIQYAEYRP